MTKLIFTVFFCLCFCMGVYGAEAGTFTGTLDHEVNGRVYTFDIDDDYEKYESGYGLFSYDEKHLYFDYFSEEDKFVKTETIYLTDNDGFSVTGYLSDNLGGHYVLFTNNSFNGTDNEVIYRICYYYKNPRIQFDEFKELKRWEINNKALGLSAVMLSTDENYLDADECNAIIYDDNGKAVLSNYKTICGIRINDIVKRRGAKYNCGFTKFVTESSDDDYNGKSYKFIKKEENRQREEYYYSVENNVIYYRGEKEDVKKYVFSVNEDDEFDGAETDERTAEDIKIHKGYVEDVPEGYRLCVDTNYLGEQFKKDVVIDEGKTIKRIYGTDAYIVTTKDGEDRIYIWSDEYYKKYYLLATGKNIGMAKPYKDGLLWVNGDGVVTRSYINKHKTVTNEIAENLSLTGFDTEISNENKFIGFKFYGNKYTINSYRLRK